MAKNSQNTLIYYVSVDISKKELLGNIRLWENIKLAYDDNLVWLKDLNAEQAESIEIKSIPGALVYYQTNNKLYLHDSLLPDRNTPSLLWTPIARALPVSLPPLNNTFFVLDDKHLDIHLIPSDEEYEAFALLTSLEELSPYIQTAPAVRLKKLRWTILEGMQILIIGKPLLPVKGKVFWRYKHLLFPVGYQINYPILSESINTRYTTPDTCICWFDERNCMKIGLTLLEELTLASFRKTFKYRRA